MEAFANRFMEMKLREIEEAEAKYVQLAEKLVEIDKKLIANFETLKIRINQEHSWYKRRKIFFAVGKFASTAVGAGFAIFYRSHVPLYIGDGANVGFVLASRINDSYYSKDTQKAMNDLIKDGREHDEIADECKHAITSFRLLVAVMEEVNNRPPETSVSTDLCVTAVKIAVHVGVTRLASRSDTWFIRVTLGYSFLSFIESALEIWNIEDIHPLMGVVDKFIDELLAEISQLENRS